MTETLSGIDVLTKVAAQRKSIINSILTNGLISAKELDKQSKPYFGSGDLTPRDFISFRLIFPPHIHKTPESFSRNLESALYLRGISVMPTMAERKVRHDPLFDPIDDAFIPSITKKFSEEEMEKTGVKQGLEARIFSSFIIVVNSSIAELIKKEKHYLFTSEEERLARLEEIGRLKEQKISPDRFSYLLFPETIWQQYETESAKINNITQVKVIKQTIKRRLFMGRVPLDVPDYENTLLEILKEHKEPIWIHGVRLPTQQEV